MCFKSIFKRKFTLPFSPQDESVAMRWTTDSSSPNKKYLQFDKTHYIPTLYNKVSFVNIS